MCDFLWGSGNLTFNLSTSKFLSDIFIFQILQVDCSSAAAAQQYSSDFSKPKLTRVTNFIFKVHSLNASQELLLLPDIKPVSTYRCLIVLNYFGRGKGGREREPKGSHKNEIWPTHVATIWSTRISFARRAHCFLPSSQSEQMSFCFHLTKRSSIWQAYSGKEQLVSNVKKNDSSLKEREEKKGKTVLMLFQSNTLPNLKLLYQVWTWPLLSNYNAGYKQWFHFEHTKPCCCKA